MPLYDYRCLKCEKEWDSYHSVEERGLEKCECGEPAVRMISKSIAKPVILEYYSEHADAVFTGPKQRERVLREKNLVCVG